MKPWLRFIRAPLLLTAVFDVLVCGLRSADISAKTDGTPLVVEFSLIGTAALSAACIYIFGMGLNDLVDCPRDRENNPDRPLPRADLSANVATLTVVVAALLACGVWLLSERHVPLVVPAALLCATLYNTLLKRNVWGGAMAMGATRFFNASALCLPFALVSDAPDMLLHYGAPLCIGLYSAAILVHSTTEEQLSTTRTWVARVLTMISFVGAAALAWMHAERPTLGAVLAFGVSSSVLFGRTPKPGPAKKQTLEMLLGLYLLAFVVLTSLAKHGLWIEGAGFVMAWCAMIGTQLAIRALRLPKPLVDNVRMP